MTVHAGFGRRHSCETGFLYRGVAVAAINSKAADMMLVAERDGLSVNNFALRVIGRALHHLKEPEHSDCRQQAAGQRKSKKCVRTRLEELSHLATNRLFVPCALLRYLLRLKRLQSG